MDEECFSDGGSFETPQKEIALKKKRTRKATANVLYMLVFIIIIIIIIIFVCGTASSNSKFVCPVFVGHEAKSRIAAFTMKEFQRSL